MKDIIEKNFEEVSSVAEMKRIVRSMWENFKDKQLNKLILSLPERMAAVIAVKGNTIRY